MRKLLASLALVFIFLSCDNGNVETDANPFVGTWENEEGYCTIFSENNVTVYRPNKNIYWTGTYTYDETYITINLDKTVSEAGIVESWGDTQLIPYRFDGEILYFNYVPLHKI
jgi:hypothetical protein